MSTDSRGTDPGRAEPLRQLIGVGERPVDQRTGETAYLLRSPANARRLLASIEELEHGGGQAQELHET